MLTPRKKQAIIAKFKKHDQDTGSAEVQIAILTEEIKELSKHLKAHKHDHSSRRGLLKKLGERRRLMRYLLNDNKDGYEKLIAELKLKPLKNSKKQDELEELLAEEAAEKELLANNAPEESTNEEK